MIDVKKFEERVNLLKSGKQLLVVHQLFGNYVVEMNSQQTRIFSETRFDGRMSDEHINYLLMWDCGSWYIYEEPAQTTCPRCHGVGIVDKVIPALMQV